MPWASVSEKPTSVKAAYLNGGLRSVACPSSIFTAASWAAAEAGSAGRKLWPARESRSRADGCQHFVALALHQLGRPRLEIQPQQRLGVRRAHVHVPIPGVDRDAVEVAHLAVAAETLLELVQLLRDVGDGRVELSGQEVPAPVVGHDLGQLPTLL